MIIHFACCSENLVTSMCIFNLNMILVFHDIEYILLKVRGSYLVIPFASCSEILVTKMLDSEIRTRFVLQDIKCILLAPV